MDRSIIGLIRDYHPAGDEPSVLRRGLFVKTVMVRSMPSGSSRHRREVDQSSRVTRGARPNSLRSRRNSTDWLATRTRTLLPSTRFVVYIPSSSRASLYAPLVTDRARPPAWGQSQPQSGRRGKAKTQPS